MSDPNCSVIICESPSTATGASWSKAVTNYRKRLRSSSSARKLLGSLYESPLNHFRRNLKPISESTEDAGDVTVVDTPPAKRRKTRNVASRQLFNPDDSIVVVAENRPAAVAQPDLDAFVLDAEENDVVEVTEVRSLVKSARKNSLVKVLRNGKSPLKRGNKLRKKRGKGATESAAIVVKRIKDGKSPKSTVRTLAVNDENHNGQIMGTTTNEDAVATASDVEEIEVVWSSGPNAESASTEVCSAREDSSRQEPMVVDVATSLPNKSKSKAKSSPVGRNAKKLVHKTKNDKSLGKKSPAKKSPGRLREIVVDGSNIAMGHSRNQVFSEKGLQIVIDYFKSRGHAVKVFLPQNSRSRNRQIIEKLHVEGIVVFTPSRTIAGRKITPYDDRYILEYATQCDGIVVTSDQYRDLWAEKPQWRNTIENRLLAPTFVGDYLMFPEDPLGRSGPKLDEFLRH